MATEAESTKARILDAAERLFAEYGFAATSLRRITSAAEVNLAAVHYHFGSKEELIRSVLARRIAPLNRERLELLDRCEEKAGVAGPSLEQIVEAFIGPPLRMSRDAARGGPAFMRLLGHAVNQPTEAMRRLVLAQFRELGHRFHAALCRACPQLPAEEVFWRLLFVVGSMSHTMVMADQLRDLSDGLCDPRDVEAIIARLVPFLCAALRAPEPAAILGGRP